MFSKSKIPFTASLFTPPDKIYKSSEYFFNSSYLILFRFRVNLLYESEDSLDKFLYPFWFLASKVSEYSPTFSSPSRKISSPIIGFIPAFLHFLKNSIAPNIEVSVIAKALIPSSPALLTYSSIFPTPSSNEYSVCNFKCTNLFSIIST